MIRLPMVKTNWGKQRLSYHAVHAVNDWNNLNDDIRSTTSTSIFLNCFNQNICPQFRGLNKHTTVAFLLQLTQLCVRNPQ